MNKGFQFRDLGITGRFDRWAALAMVALWVTSAHAGSVQLPAVIQEYTPFEVVVTTDQPLCVGFPVVGDMQYSNGTLVTVLTHLAAPGRDRFCNGQKSRTVTIPGLPRGAQTLRFDATAGDRYPEINGAVVVESVATTVTVAPAPGIRSVNFWTGTYTPGIYTSKVLTFFLSPSRFSMFLGQNDWLEVGPGESSYTFKGFQIDANAALPPGLVRLSTVLYPNPFSGVFWSTDVAAANRLAGEWGNPRNETNYAVGKLVAGACPIGMSPVYQAFHPATVTHRWTQSRTAYATMLGNGYQGDGAVWCAPALRGE